eukprot:6731906-Pyramimonas_sp.AAC.1
MTQIQQVRRFARIPRIGAGPPLRRLRRRPWRAPGAPGRGPRRPPSFVLRLCHCLSPISSSVRVERIHRDSESDRSCGFFRSFEQPSLGCDVPLRVLQPPGCDVCRSEFEAPVPLTRHLFLSSSSASSYIRSSPFPVAHNTTGFGRFPRSVMTRVCE